MSGRRITTAALSTAFHCVAALFTFAAAWAQGLPVAPAESVGMSAQNFAPHCGNLQEGNRPGQAARRGVPGGAQRQAGVSVAAMMLVEDGRIQLTDPVSKFLPAMKNLQVSAAKTDAEFARVTYTLVPADREMTVQDLMRHTAGLAYGELTQNAPVKEALGKAGIYKTNIE